jgi:hypothetical protein
MSAAAEIIKTLVEQTQNQLNKEPTETDVIALAFSLVPKVEQLAKGELKGSDKMEVLLSTLDGLLNVCNQEIAGPLRASLRDRIVPAVSGLIGASKNGNISLGVASAVALTTEVVSVASKGCFCFGKKAIAAVAAPAPAATSTELPCLPPSPTRSEASAESTISV